MDGTAPDYRPDRHPSESYDDILNRDTRPVPAFLRQGPTPDIGVDPVPAANYFSAELFAKETEKLWPKVWQMACREEDIPNVGDYQIYEIVGKSFIVVRSAADEIKAFYNSCLHRGRKLVTLNGCKNEFRCPFHGIAWNADGTFKDNPIAWDFPQWRDRDMSLPQARVETWGGFVFINMDPDAPPLASVLAPLAQHFEGYDYANRYKAVHVAKIVRCNWKVAAEAFMESHHSIATHPQILPFLADANSQYDLLSDFVSRQFSASGVPSPFVADRNYSPAEIIQAMRGVSDRTRRGGLSGDAVEVPEGVTARAYAAEQARQVLGAEDGWDYAGASDAEMVDSLLYNVWPHMSFWAGYSPTLVYRWRPNGLDPESSIMDVMILKRVPKAGPRPAPVPVHELGIDDPWSDAPELGGLIGIFEQDMGNLPYVQEGLHASGTGTVHFSRYTELRIRKLHQMIALYLKS
ncbi:MAG: aromatic ring-hydroxylating dioxygenase subunit alpha [Caulobacterales bacterium]|nr:aromatic ring-hydroxylating dioxygenase subunit alpha [Caulobacterales bacterium]